MKVYLAGPITGLTYDMADSWRYYATRNLAPAGIIAVSPLRGKEYLTTLGKLSGNGREYLDISALSNPPGVLTRDHWDCRRADAILANLLGATHVSIGTVMEIAWAHAYHKPLVLVMEPEGNPHDHMMLTQVAGFQVKTLDEGLTVIKALKAGG